MEYKTKEQIWQEQENNPALSFSESALIAMEEYALCFAEWINRNAGMDDDGFFWRYKGQLTTTQELHQIFIESQK